MKSELDWDVLSDEGEGKGVLFEIISNLKLLASFKEIWLQALTVSL